MEDSLKITLFIIVFILVGGVLGASCWANISGANKDEAEKEARAYAQTLGLQLQGVDCARNDSDNDGYVSCTLIVKQASGDLTPMPIECAVKYTTNDGCRMQKPGSRRY